MTKILLVLNLVAIILVGASVTSKLNALDKALYSVQKLIAADMTAPDPMYDNRPTPPQEHNWSPWNKPSPGGTF